MDNIKMRDAKEEDLDLIISFIKKIAHYEKMDSDYVASKENLHKWIFERKLCETIFLEVNDKPVAFCIYFYNFSTFQGKGGIHVEDIYVDEEYRGRGFGKMLFKEIFKRAKENDCGRIEWTCLKWNEPSKKFYESMGARDMDEWITYRLTDSQFDELLK